MKHWPINRQLFIVAAAPSFVALLIFVVFNYKEVHDIYQLNKERNRQVIKKLTPSYMQISNKPIDYLETKYNSRLEGLSLQWQHFFDTTSVIPEHTDLKKIGAKIGMDLENESIYLLNKKGTVFNTTFLADSGVNLFKFGDIHKRIYDKIMTKGEFHAFDPIREMHTGRFRKYSYMPDTRKRFMIEMGSYAPEIDSVVVFVQNSISKIIENYPEIVGIDILYGNLDAIVLNKPSVKIEAEVLDTFHEVVGKEKNKIVKLPNKLERHYVYLPKASPSQIKETVILITIDNKIHEKSLRKLMLKMLLVFVTLIAVIAYLAIVNARWLVRPLRNLMDVVHAIEQGDLKARAGSNGSKEMKYLSRRINKMAEQIQDGYEKLEQKVAERTATIDNKNKELEHQKERLEEQNQTLSEAKNHIDRQQDEIMAGIRAAERLQRIILPKELDLYKLTRAAFIVNIPKDYVSGDFYWAAEINDKVIVALGDCTGHGVSGAILSILGNEIFNKVIKGKGITTPNEILVGVDEGLKSILQHSSSLHYKDGMDLAVCSFDKANLKMEYAAANTRLYLARKKQIEELRGDKNSIGDVIQRSHQRFTNHEVELHKGDMIYLTSDGFADQFGGENNKKFTRKKLRALLSEMSSRPISLQKLLAIQHYDEWKGTNFQVDDVLMIGIRV